MATLEAGQEFVYRREVLNSRTSFRQTCESAANLLPVLSIIPRLARGMSVNAWDVQVAMTSFNGVRAALAVLVQNMTMLRTAETHATNVSNLYDALDASSTRASMAADKNGAAIGSSVHAETPEDDMSLVEVEALTVLAGTTVSTSFAGSISSSAAEILSPSSVHRDVGRRCS